MKALTMALVGVVGIGYIGFRIAFFLSSFALGAFIISDAFVFLEPHIGILAYIGCLFLAPFLCLTSFGYPWVQSWLLQEPLDETVHLVWSVWIVCLFLTLIFSVISSKTED
jgi:hypothetical protein